MNLLTKVIERNWLQTLTQWSPSSVSLTWMHLGAKKIPTYLDLYNQWQDRFIEAKIPEPQESAGYIFAHILGRKTFSVVPLHCLQQRMSQEDVFTANKLCHQRLKRVPVQYITGEWDFFGINLAMRPPVFIPRPETEELAEHVLDSIRAHLSNSKRDSPCKVLEVGSGTGAITLSLLHKLQLEDVQFVAIDEALHAVSLAQENAKKLKLDTLNKLNVMHHCLNVQKDSKLVALKPFDIIVSNPPYIPTRDMADLPEEILRYEDPVALHGGKDGLDVIRVLLNAAGELLTDHGSIWLEVDPSHPFMLNAHFSDWSVKTFKDIFGKERFCRLTRLR